jgi:hypothetical protein
VLVELWEWAITFQGCISLLSLIVFLGGCMLAASTYDHYRPDYHQIFSDQLERIRKQQKQQEKED